MGIPIGAHVAAKIQLYTQLVCLTHRPEYTTDYSPAPGSPSNSIWGFPKLAEPNELCMADPHVQASVATLLAGMFPTHLLI